MTYRSPFSLLWYSGMPSPSDFLTSFGFVITWIFCQWVKFIVCKLAFSHKIISCRVQNSLKSLQVTLVPISTAWLSRCFMFFSNPTRASDCNERWKLSGWQQI
jgi:hypothetical protein